MCICQFQVYLLGSLWNSFMRCRFPLDRVGSGCSELLITCLISLELPLSPPASAVFYKDTHFPLEMSPHEMTSKEMAIPMRPASKKRAYCLLSWSQNRCTKALYLTGNSFEKQIVFKIFFRMTGLHWCVFLSQRNSLWWAFSVFTVWLYLTQPAVIWLSTKSISYLPLRHWGTQLDRPTHLVFVYARKTGWYSVKD